MTGTLLVNSSHDLAAMVSFTRLCAPLDEKKNWSKFVERRIRKGNGSAVIKAIVNTVRPRA